MSPINPSRVLADGSHDMARDIDDLPWWFALSLFVVLGYFLWLTWP